MLFQSKLFGSPDSKYFLRTAFRVLLVPILTTFVMAYSLWIYMDLNYYFFTSKGLSISTVMKDAFIDHLVTGQTDSLPYVGLFFVMVFFLGLFLAHLVLRPFKWIAQFCRESLQNEDVELHLDKLTQRQLVVRSTNLLLNFIRTRDHSIPADLARITGPRLDKIFYFQYGMCILILSLLTGGAVYMSLNLLHEEIVNSAMVFLKTDTQIVNFLMNQQVLISNIGIFCAGFSVFMYILLAHGLVKDVEGVSYAYLRDIRKVIEGDYGRRLRPRFIDPGTDAALALNQLLDHYFPNNVEEDGLNPPPPIPLKQEVEVLPDQKEIEKMFGSKE